LDSASTLDAANSKTGSVGEAAHNSSLPLERALERLVELVGLREVDDVDVAVGGTNDEHLVSDRVHGVDAILALQGSDGVGCAQIPVLDGLVPRASDEHGGVVYGDGLDAADRLVVGSDLGSLGSAGTEIEHSRGLVCASSKDFASILLIC